MTENLTVMDLINYEITQHEKELSILKAMKAKIEHNNKYMYVLGDIYSRHSIRVNHYVNTYDDISFINMLEQYINHCHKVTFYDKDGSILYEYSDECRLTQPRVILYNYKECHSEALAIQAKLLTILKEKEHEKKQ